ncbi:MAG: hypothetical protein PGN11_03265 [Quadrisphaera sp.]
MRPGREHDLTCGRTHPGLLDAVDDISVDGQFVLADLRYEGEDIWLATPHKQKSVPKRKDFTKRKKVPLSDACRMIDILHARLRSRAEEGSAWFEATFEALHLVGLDPERIGAIAAAALAWLHWKRDRTTRLNVTAEPLLRRAHWAPPEDQIFLVISSPSMQTSHA